MRILRQDGPGQPSYWERHRVEYESDMNVISVLQRIAAQAKTVDGKHVAPVAWDCNCLEEVCGACTMVINGRVRQACSALVDRLLDDNPGEIELRPMTQVPGASATWWSTARGCSGPCKGPGLDPRRRLLRHGPRPAAVAGSSRRRRIRSASA